MLLIKNGNVKKLCWLQPCGEHLLFSLQQNLFLLLRCPWCGAQMGPQPKKGGGQETIGYEEAAGKVVLRCIDGECKYSRRAGLPVHVVDDDIYEEVIIDDEGDDED